MAPGMTFPGSCPALSCMNLCIRKARLAVCIHLSLDSNYLKRQDRPRQCLAQHKGLLLPDGTREYSPQRLQKSIRQRHRG